MHKLESDSTQVTWIENNTNLRPFRKALFSALCLIALVTTSCNKPANQSSALNDHDTIQGTWQAVSIEKKGRNYIPDIVKDIKWIITKDTITYIQPAVRDTVVTYELDQTKKPKWIDVNEVGEEKDKTTQGIYELDGDTLRVCFTVNRINRERPTAFETSPDSPNVSFTFKREKR